jgi:hypothetical protein
VVAGVAPEFMPKHNSEPIQNGGRTTDEAARLEIGEMRDGRLYGAETCIRVGACTRSQRGRRDSLGPASGCATACGAAAALVVAGSGSLASTEHVEL